MSRAKCDENIVATVKPRAYSLLSHLYRTLPNDGLQERNPRQAADLADVLGYRQRALLVALCAVFSGSEILMRAKS